MGDPPLFEDLSSNKDFCVVAVQFIRRPHYGLEISKLVFVVVVGKRFHNGLLLMQHRYLMVYK
jgi:hypothetical protein